MPNNFLLHKLLCSSFLLNLVQNLINRNSNFNLNKNFIKLFIGFDRYQKIKNYNPKNKIINYQAEINQ